MGLGIVEFVILPGLDDMPPSLPTINAHADAHRSGELISGREGGSGRNEEMSRNFRYRGTGTNLGHAIQIRLEFHTGIRLALLCEGHLRQGRRNEDQYKFFEFHMFLNIVPYINICSIPSENHRLNAG